MKSLVLTGVFLFALQGDMKWQTLRVDSEGFSISMPGKPGQDTQGLRSANQSSKIRVYTVRVADEVYSVSVVPVESAKSENVDAGLAAAAAGIVANAKGKALEERGITIAGNPGRYVKFSIGSDLFGKANVLLAKGRLYQWFVIGPRNRVDSSDATRFLNSFRLLP